MGKSSLFYLYDVNKSRPAVLSDGTYTYVYGVGLAFAVDGICNLQVYHTDEFGVPTPVRAPSTKPFQNLSVC